jgi:cytochrome c-type biogenesis protein CcmF
MIAVVGTVSLALALLFAAAGIAALAVGVRRRDLRGLARGHAAAIGVFASVTLAVLAMETGLVGSDFSIRYVAANVNRVTPLLFRIAGLWGALEGSILLWVWILSALTVLVARRSRDRHPDLLPYVLGVLFAIAAFFLGLTVGPANPFARLPVAPPDGVGLNPLLQNHPLMAVHPPFLYLGYVGFSVPFAFALGSLISGVHRDAWMRLTRRWTLVAWTALTAGLFLGARWSYDVLGWGGYWAWDPVENAAVMPWLVATAFLHSTMVQERRQLLRVWNLGLIIVVFLLTIFGTFLTRSGVVASVHSFTQSLIGPLFVGFLGATVLTSLGALLWRRGQVRDEGAFDSPLSREAMMLLNNLVLVTMAFAVFVGTLFPLAVEVATGAKVTIGPPFFDRVVGPLGVLLLVVMGTGTALRWGRSGPDELRKLWALAAAALVATGALAAAGVHSPTALIALGAATFVALAQVTEYARGTWAHHTATGDGLLSSWVALFSINPQRYYGYLTHLGLVVAVAGIVASQSGRIEVQRHLLVGQMMQVGRYTLRLESLEALVAPDRIIVAAPLAVGFQNATAQAGTSPSPTDRDTLRPSQNFFRQARTPLASPAVHSTWREDLYVALLAFDPREQSAVFRVVISPMVSWLWAGGAIMVTAGVLALWPTRRR